MHSHPVNVGLMVRWAAGHMHAYAIFLGHLAAWKQDLLLQPAKCGIHTMHGHMIAVPRGSAVWPHLYTSEQTTHHPPGMTSMVRADTTV